MNDKQTSLKTTCAAQLGATRAVGAKTLAQWSKDEVGTLGWKTGKIEYYLHRQYFLFFEGELPSSNDKAVQEA